MIKFDNVDFRYKKAARNALSNLSFEIKEGEFCAFVGNNGCGKTTTINLICNLMQSQKGEIFIFGKKMNIDDVWHRAKIGFMLSEPTYIEQLSIKEYLSFVCKFQNIPKVETELRINEITRLLGLSDSTKEIISNLSRGNQIKVSLCSALIHNPVLLVLDEPFVHLDVDTTQFLINIFKSFKGKKTIFVTSHNIDLIADLCDRFLIMEQGQIIQDIRKNIDDNADSIKQKIIGLLSSNNLTTNIPKWLNS